MSYSINLKSFIFFFVTYSSLLISFNCHDDDDPPLLLLKNKKQVALFIFGASLFDAGNNNYINTTIKANFRPYGESFFDYPTGRFSDGRLIPDFIAEYAKLPFIPTFLPFRKDDQFTSGVNFASAGAGALVGTNQGQVIDLKSQLSNLKTVKKLLKKKLGDEEEAETLFSEAVYLFNVGTNDYIFLFRSDSSNKNLLFLKKEYVGMVIGNLTNTIIEIYKTGGRKFAFVNAAPLGFVPGFKVLFPGSVDDAQELVQLHNKELLKALKDLEESQLEGFKYAVHDFYTSVSQRINNPSQYGMQSSSSCRRYCKNYKSHFVFVVLPCGSGLYRGEMSCGRSSKGAAKGYELCPNPSEYLFFDSVHPCEKVNEQISELIWNGTPDVTGPYNVKMLFGGHI